MRVLAKGRAVVPKMVSGTFLAGSRELGYAASTDIGLVRSHNEDALGVLPGLGLFAVADGVGGGPRGEVASLAAVNALAGFIAALDTPTLRPHIATDACEALRAAMECAHECAFDEGSHQATTLVALWVGGVHAVVGAAGDSPAYRWRAGALERLTCHPRPAGEIWPGGANFLSPELRVEEIAAGDVFVLCSDGLSDLVDQVAVAGVLGSPGALDVQCAELVALARAAGGRDNISVVLVGAGCRPARARAGGARNVVVDVEPVEFQPWRVELSERDRAVLEQVGLRWQALSRGAALHSMVVGRPGPQMEPFENLPSTGPTSTSYVPVHWGEFAERLLEQAGTADRQCWLRGILDVWIR